MKVLIAVICLLCPLVVSCGRSPVTSNEGPIKLRIDQEVSIFPGGELNVYVGRVDTSAVVYVRRAGKEIYFLKYNLTTGSARVESSYEVGGQQITVVDADGQGVPNHRRIKEDGKGTTAEIFVDGKFIAPRKEGGTWIADGRAFVYRDGRFQRVNSVKQGESVNQ